MTRPPPTYALDEARARAYDAWYDRHEAAYETEVAALREALPGGGRGVEVGAGTGRFGTRLGIGLSIEPDPNMAKIARARGAQVVLGVGEALPIKSASLDSVLMVTSLCFTSEPEAAIREAARVLRAGGTAAIGDVDPDSFLGREYESKQPTSESLRRARFHRVAELGMWLDAAGFRDARVRQTLFHLPTEIRAIEPNPRRPRRGRLRGRLRSHSRRTRRSLTSSSHCCRVLPRLPLRSIQPRPLGMRFGRAPSARVAVWMAYSRPRWRAREPGKLRRIPATSFTE